MTSAPSLASFLAHRQPAQRPTEPASASADDLVPRVLPPASVRSKRRFERLDVVAAEGHIAKSPGAARRVHYADALNTLLTAAEPQIVGHYVLGNTVGKGAYGVVKVATHMLTNQQVAIKIMDKSYAPLIMREVDSWRHLRHQHIAQLYEVIGTESKIYLVMEYARSGELFDYIVQRGHLREREARRIFTQLAHAVGYCHHKGFVHRDLKPENLLLDSNMSIKVIDFGFTKRYDPTKLLNSFCGSVAYAAPELILKEKYTGPETDIWSLGVILYALLVGRLPFDDPNGNEKEIFRKILALEYDRDCKISDAAKDLIDNILRRNPKDRLSISSILAHEWLTSNSDTTSLSDNHQDSDDSTCKSVPAQSNAGRGDDLDFDSVGTSESDQEIIDIMASLGIDRQNLLASLRECIPDSLSAIFFLFRRKFASDSREAGPAPVVTVASADPVAISSSNPALALRLKLKTSSDSNLLGAQQPKESTVADDNGINSELGRTKLPAQYSQPATHTAIAQKPAMPVPKPPTAQHPMSLVGMGASSLGSNNANTVAGNPFLSSNNNRFPTRRSPTKAAHANLSGIAEESEEDGSGNTSRAVTRRASSPSVEGIAPSVRRPVRRSSWASRFIPSISDDDSILTSDGELATEREANTKFPVAAHTKAFSDETGYMSVPEDGRPEDPAQNQPVIIGADKIVVDEGKPVATEMSSHSIASLLSTPTSASTTAVDSPSPETTPSMTVAASTASLVIDSLEDELTPRLIVSRVAVATLTDTVAVSLSPNPITSPVTSENMLFSDLIKEIHVPKDNARRDSNASEDLFQLEMCDSPRSSVETALPPTPKGNAPTSLGRSLEISDPDESDDELPGVRLAAIRTTLSSSSRSQFSSAHSSASDAQLAQQGPEESPNNPKSPTRGVFLPNLRKMVLSFVPPRRHSLDPRSSLGGDEFGESEPADPARFAQRKQSDTTGISPSAALRILHAKHAAAATAANVVPTLPTTSSMQKRPSALPSTSSPCSEPEIRKVRDGVFGVTTTSTREASCLVEEILRVLMTFRIPFERMENYRFVIDFSIARAPIQDSVVQALAPLPRHHQGTSSSDLNAMLDNYELIHQVKFELELCGLAGDLRGIRLKRLEGDTWVYMNLCNAILHELRL